MDFDLPQENDIISSRSPKHPKSATTAWVYALLDSDGRVGYVGFTNHPYSRLRHHLVMYRTAASIGPSTRQGRVAVRNLPKLAAWMASLDAPPVMQLLTGPTRPDRARLIEASTIQLYKAAGHPIANASSRPP